MRVTMFPGRLSIEGNPFINILVDALSDAGVQVRHFNPLLPHRPDNVFHIHWLEGVFWGRISSRMNWVARLNARRTVNHARVVRAEGGKVVWTVHNLVPHEGVTPARRDIWANYVAELLPLVTDVVVMSDSVEADVVAEYPQVTGAAFHVVPHPHYREFFSRYGGSRDLRADLGVSRDCPVFACIGHVRRYKQIVETITLLRNNYFDDFRLIVAGDGDPAYSSEIRAAMAGDRRFHFDKRRLRHAEVVDYLRAADVAIFNFRRILNSGSVLSALSLGTPVICPSLGGLNTLAHRLGPDWVRCYDPPLDGAWLVENLHQLTRMSHRSELDLGEMSPDTVARLLLGVYRGRAT